MKHSKLEPIIVFQLKFPIAELQSWAAEYNFDKPELERKIVEVIAPSVKSKGFLDKQQFVDVCNWKTDRSKTRCLKNDDSYVEKITQIALSSTHERIRIQTLTLLDGVQWPTASVILHFFHDQQYPILDFRALWSLGIETPPVQYAFDFWITYVAYCRELAKTSGSDMRTIDRALWAYSKKNQKSGE